MARTSIGRTTSGFAALIAAAGTLLLLVLAPVASAHAAGDDADITVDFGCDSVEVASSKDISNVVVSFADGSTERFEGLNGNSWSRVFDREVAEVWVKSGSNASGDGPGYGERFASDADCDVQGTATEGRQADLERPASEPQRTDQVTPEQGASAQITLEFDCQAVIVESSKDISNVVVSFADGSTERFEGLNGNSWSRVFDREVAEVWVKSGSNASGDGPGYGERFASDADCGGQQPPSNQQPVVDVVTPDDVTPDDVTRPPAVTQPPAASVESVPQAVNGVVGPTPDTAVLGVTVERPVAAAGPDAHVVGLRSEAAPSTLARTGVDAGWLLALGVALSVCGLVALDLTGRRARS